MLFFLQLLSFDYLKKLFLKIRELFEEVTPNYLLVGKLQPVIAFVYFIILALKVHGVVHGGL